MEEYRPPPSPTHFFSRWEIVCVEENVQREKKKIKTGLENNFIVVFSPDDEVAWRFHDVTIIDKSPMACSP